MRITRPRPSAPLLLAWALMHVSGVYGATGPFQFITIHGTFTVPREFRPSDAWETIRLGPQSTNYFIAKLPSGYVHERIQAFIPRLNHVDQGVTFVVEALSERRRVEIEPYELCEQRTHDLEPKSKPYNRCEYRRILNEDFAVKFWLNGTNTHLKDSVANFIAKHLLRWHQGPAAR